MKGTDNAEHLPVTASLPLLGLCTMSRQLFEAVGWVTVRASTIKPAQTLLH